MFRITSFFEIQGWKNLDCYNLTVTDVIRRREKDLSHFQLAVGGKQAHQVEGAELINKKKDQPYGEQWEETEYWRHIKWKEVELFNVKKIRRKLILSMVSPATTTWMKGNAYNKILGETSRKQLLNFTLLWVLQRGKTPPPRHKCPGYDTKQYYGVAPVILEL